MGLYVISSRGLSWSNVSKFKSLKYCSLKVLSKCICHCLCHCHCHCGCLRHCLFAFSSPWSNVLKVKSLKDCSLNVFSKCICICHCLCLLYLSLSLSFCWSGHVFLWPQSILQGFGLVGKAGRLWIHNNQCNSQWQVTKVGLELLGQLKRQYIY